MKTQQANKITTAFVKVGRAKNPRIVNGDGGRVGCVGVDPRLGSGSDGELGRVGPTVNLFFDFGPFLYLCAEAGWGEDVLDDFELVRSDNGCKNGGEKEDSPRGFWGLASDESCCRLGEPRFGCDRECWFGFRWEGFMVPNGGAPAGYNPEA